MMAPRPVDTVPSPPAIALPDRSRRRLLHAVPALAGMSLLGGFARSGERYEDVGRTLRLPPTGQADSLELIRHAMLAANGHNTQPWHFEPHDAGVHIVPDFSRRST